MGTRRKLDRPAELKHLRIYTDQLERIAEYFPGQGENQVIRILLDKILAIVAEGRNKATKTEQFHV